MSFINYTLNNKRKFLGAEMICMCLPSWQINCKYHHSANTDLQGKFVCGHAVSVRLARITEWEIVKNNITLPYSFIQQWSLA